MFAPRQALAVLEAALASGEETVAVGMTGENAATFILNGISGGMHAARAVQGRAGQLRVVRRSRKPAWMPARLTRRPCWRLSAIALATRGR